MWFDRKWHSSEGVVQLQELIQQLTLTREAKGHRREIKSTSSFFYIEELDAVVIAEFDSPTKKETRDRVDKTIRNCLDHALNAYAARHDPLTGLLNRSGLEKAFQARLSDLAIGRANAQHLSEAKGVPSICMLAFDIDHFKQVNDMHGHQYGDIVLRCFARHIEENAKTLDSAKDGSVSILVARPGGEEFAIIVIGTLGREELKRFADFLRSSIQNASLPTESEWVQYGGGSLDDIPHVSERRITTSVGIAISGIPIDPRVVKQTLASLISQSDAALYRAKSGGRNIVRDYADILEKYGRVLEDHKDTGIVAIDIGKQVGVEKGQEFLVFHPDFSGDTPFYYSDGRTKKRIGFYPRHPMARVIVMDVQQEMSFCKVVTASRISAAAIPVGSWLQAIPIGSIGHLVSGDEASHPVDGAADTTGYDGISKYVNGLLREKKSPVALAFGIDALDSLRQTKGVGFVNQVLASLYRAMRAAIPSDVRIGQFRETRFVAVFADFDGFEPTALASKITNDAKKQYGGRVNFLSGYYRAAGERENNTGTYDPRNAIEMALYTLADEVHGPEADEVIEFGHELAHDIVYALRQAQKYSKALMDYKNLRALGIKDAYFENQAALCAFESDEPDYELAALALERAIELEPKQGIFLANAGLVEHGRENFELADEYFQKAEAINFEYPSMYLGPVASSAARACLRGGAVTDRAIAALQRALTLDEQKHMLVEREELKIFDEMLRNQAGASEYMV